MKVSMVGGVYVCIHTHISTSTDIYRTEFSGLVNGHSC